MIRKIFHFIIAFFVKRMSISTERIFWLVLQSAIKHKFLIVSAFAANTIAALFEGVSLALFALAISVVTGDMSGVAVFDSWMVRLFGLSLGHLDRDVLFFAFITMAILGQLIKSAFHLAGIASTIYLRTYAIGDIQSNMVRQIMSFSLSQVNKYPGGELSTYVGLSASITSFLLILNAVMSKVLLVLSYLLIMFSMSASLTLLSFVAGGLLMFFLSNLFVKLKDYGRAVTQAGISLGKEVMEFLYAPKFLRVYGKENYAGNIIIDQIDKGLMARRKGELLRAIINPTFESVAIVLAGFLIVGGYYMLPESDASTRLPTLLAFVVVFRRLMTALSDLNSDRAAIANIIPSAEVVAEALRDDNKDFTSQDGVYISRLDVGISLKNVGFTYNSGDKPILSDINLDIPKGSVIGIVGASGSGKTTLVDVILGLYPPQAGDITMDGVSISKILPSSWRKQFGVVSQDSAIFNRSIKENLAIVNPDAMDNDITNAAKVAYAHEFISEQENGYDTVIGDRGHKLSGGQVQRLALARAILANAAVLVLDEATSALDSLSEKKIIEAVNKLGDNHTIIQVAHRLSTIFHADIIIVMKDGRIIEQGTHSELLAFNGEYSDMWEAQSLSGDMSAGN